MKKLFIVFVILVIFAAGVYVWLGGFSPVNISEGNAGSFELLYQEHTGSYSKIYPVIQDVAKIAKENQIAYDTTFGIYYDNPRYVSEDKLRSIAGVIVNEEGLSKAKALIKDGKIKHRSIKEQSYAKTEFPYKNMISMILAVGKVYPAYAQYWKAHNYAEMTFKEKDFQNDFAMEIYKKDKIEYLMTLP